MNGSPFRRDNWMQDDRTGRSWDSMLMIVCSQRSMAARRVDGGDSSYRPSYNVIGSAAAKGGLRKATGSYQFLGGLLGSIGRQRKEESVIIGTGWAGRDRS